MAGIHQGRFLPARKKFSCDLLASLAKRKPKEKNHTMKTPTHIQSSKLNGTTFSPSFVILLLVY
jgi:hypothetical protein